MSVITGMNIGKKLVEALGLPPRTLWFELRVASDEIVTVTCAYAADGEGVDKAIEIIKVYELHEFRTPEGNA